ALRVVARGLQASTRYRVTAGTAFGSRSIAVTTLPRALPPQGMTMAVATCYYSGYRRDKVLADALSVARWDQLPALHLWAGDNLYMDVPGFPSANQPVHQTLARYLSYFLESDYADVRALAPTLTTYDDHEYWNNFPQAVPWLPRSADPHWAGYRDAAIEGMRVFQNQLNPETGGLGYYKVRVPPLEIFVLDTRSFRSRLHLGPQRLLAPGALAALKDWALNLNGPGVLVLGQPLWIQPGDWRDLNLPAYEQDYAAIWQALRTAPYDMLVVSGDVHHSRVLKIAFGGAPNRFVYEFVTSPACHIPTIVGVNQDRGTLKDLPSKVDRAKQTLSAQAFFGTSAQQCVGLLRFVPLPHGEIRVGASFIDCNPKERFATAEAITTVPKIGSYTVCHDLDLFTLRMR
ncbi:MAG TPA: alkaline phosphatase D family protein, partial [Polyangiales bacterium]|nr:alkaline phosphatase D family protein [Polyangiales bacterium]